MTAISHHTVSNAQLQVLHANLHETIQDWINEMSFYQREISFLEKIITQASLGSNDLTYDQLIEQLKHLQQERIIPLSNYLKQNAFVKKAKTPTPVNFQQLRADRRVLQKDYQQLKEQVFQKVEDITSIEIW